MIADEFRVGDWREWVINLQIEQVPNASALHVVDRTAGCQSCDRAAVTVGA